MNVRPLGLCLACALACGGALASRTATDSPSAPDANGTVLSVNAPAAVSPTASGTTLVDFAKDAFGWLEFVPPAGVRGEYEVRLGEKLTAEGRVDMKPGGTIRAAEVRGTIAADGSHRVPLVADPRNTCGTNRLAKAVALAPERGVVMPFRYAEVVKAPFAPSAANVRRQMLHWPMDMKAAGFRSSSPELNRLYEFCKYTMLATSFAGVYVDGDRERIPYEADAYINQLGHYAVDADYALARKTFEWLMEHPTWPTEWKQYMIMIAWNDWMWSGSTGLVARYYDRLVKEKLLLDWARADALVVSVPKRARADSGDIVDWPVGERDGFVFRPVNAVVNAFHYRNLLQMAEIAAALGKKEDETNFRARAGRVKAAYETVFYRPRLCAYADGEGTDHTSLHANAAALACGLVPAERKRAIADFLVAKGMACSVYFAQYLLEALFEGGRADAAVRLMTAGGERSWMGMMEQGSTLAMEAWSLKAKRNQDWNHAWGTAPLNIIVRYVLGVRPTKPGFAEYEVKPQLGGLTFVEGTVPTPRGPIHVRR